MCFTDRKGKEWLWAKSPWISWSARQTNWGGVFPGDKEGCRAWPIDETLRHVFGMAGTWVIGVPQLKYMTRKVVCGTLMILNFTKYEEDIKVIKSQTHSNYPS